MAAASAVFKEDQLFLWDDASGNTALGRHALATADGNTVGNTAVGRNALTSSALGGGSSYDGSFKTAVGLDALAVNTTGYQNTAVGANALASNTTGYRNTATGYEALAANTEGFFNTATGFWSLHNNTTGNANTTLGYKAGYSATGSSNVLINHTGAAVESNVLRIGQSTSTGEAVRRALARQGVH